MPRLLLAAGLAAALAVPAGAAAPSSADYAKRIGRLCWRYERQLQRIPPPGSDLASLHATAARVLPLLRAQLAAVRRVPSPAAEAAAVKELLFRSEGSIAALEQLQKARTEQVAAAALAVFLGERDAGRAVNDRLGIRCAP